MSSEPNNKHKSYSFEAISSSHLTFLRLCSFLPLKGKGFSHPLSLLLQLWDHLVVIGFNMIWQSYKIRMIQRGDVEIDYICEDMIITGVTTRYIVLCMKREQLCHLVEFCKKIWGYLKAHEHIFMNDFMRRSYFFRNFLLFNGLFMATAYNITALFTRLPPLEANGTERKMLPFRFFMDVQEDPAYSFVFVLQVVLLYSMNMVIVSIETVSLYLIMMACGFLRTVQNRLLSLRVSVDDTSEKDEAALSIVVGCAHFHQQIMIYCENIDRITRTLFLFACFCPIYNLSITGIVLINNDEDKFKFMAVMVTNFFQFFLCQWAPDHLTGESDVIAEAAYFASLQPWTSIHRQKINRILYFMMMRAQKPVQLTAGGFVKLSIETFGTMTKSAFSFFMVLLSFRT